MNEWIRKHQKRLSLVVGIILIVGAVIALFWDNRGDAVSEEERLAAERVARHEARMSAATATGKAPQQAPKPMFMEAYREKQKTQLRYAVIVLLITGVGFVGYSLLKKEA